MFVDLISAQNEVKADISSLEFATTGGAICAPTMYKNIKTKLGLRAVSVTLKQLYNSIKFLTFIKS